MIIKLICDYNVVTWNCELWNSPKRNLSSKRLCFMTSDQITYYTLLYDSHTNNEKRLIDYLASKICDIRRWDKGKRNVAGRTRKNAHSSRKDATHIFWVCRVFAILLSVFGGWNIWMNLKRWLSLCCCCTQLATEALFGMNCARLPWVSGFLLSII